MAKLNKKKMSDEINDAMGLKGEDCINWTRLATDDLTAFYIMLMNPEQLMNVAQSIAGKMMPGMKGQMGEMAKDMMGGMLGTMGAEGSISLLSDRAADMVDKAPILQDRPIAKQILKRALERVQKKKEEGTK